MPRYPYQKRRYTIETGPRPSRTASLRRKQQLESNRRRGRLVVPRNKLAFPKSLRTQLRYVERIQDALISTTTNATMTPFRANGLHDPFYAMGGHQPRGFDQFMAQYETYTCLSSTISVNFMFGGYDGPGYMSTSDSNMVKTSDSAAALIDSSAPPAVICGIFKGVDVLGTDSAEHQMEKDNQRWVVITPNGPSKTLSAKMHCSEFFGKGALVGAEGYTGTDSSDPANEVIWDVWWGKSSVVNTNIKIRIIAYVTITYDVVFTEPKTLVAS